MRVAEIDRFASATATYPRSGGRSRPRDLKADRLQPLPTPRARQPRRSSARNPAIRRFGPAAQSPSRRSGSRMSFRRRSTVRPLRSAALRCAKMQTDRVSRLRDRQAVASTDGGVSERHWARRASLGRKVDSGQTEPCRRALNPLKVVHERPIQIAAHIDTAV